MRYLKVVYNGIKCEARGSSASGQVGTFRAVFSFSPDWEAYPTRTAVFVSGGFPVAVVLDENNECDVPPQITKNGGRILVGAFGTGTAEDGSILRYPGEYAAENITEGVTPHAAAPTPQDVTAYEQLLVRLKVVEEKLDKAVEYAKNAAEAANNAASNANSAADRANEAAERAENIVPGGAVNSGKLLYVDDAGNVAFLKLGDGLEIVDGRLCIVGTVTPDKPDVPDEPDIPVEPDEPAEAITFTQTGENSVAVSNVVFEQQADGTVLWGGATFTPGEENSVNIS